jgi:integrase
MKTWTAAQASQFLAAVDNPRWAAAYWLLLTAGLRVGELCGLRWPDVDMETGRLQIRRTLQRVIGVGIVVGETKTDRPRSVLLTPGAIASLRKWRAVQNGWRLTAGSNWPSEDYVLSTANGTAIELNNVTRDMTGRVRRLGLPLIRVHDLRHTCATLLLERGVNQKVVQEMLGHRRIGTTLDLYAHVTPTMQGQAVAAMSEVLG